MVTDSAILTAARQHQQAQDAVKEAQRVAERANVDQILPADVRHAMRRWDV